MVLRSNVREWLFALALYLPIASFYTAHYAAGVKDPDRIGTGFIQYDQPSYMASVREYIDGSHRGPLYALPRDHNYDAEPTMLQLHLWGLSFIWGWTGMDPGLLFVLFGAVSGILAIRTFLLLFDHCVPVTGWRRRWGQLLFVWGGGVFCIAGGLLSYIKGVRGADLLRECFTLDPAGGWWFMNLGRNLVYPNEAFYHFMFFAALLLIMRGRFLGAAVVAFVLAWSHPFAGVGLLAITTTWTLLERFYVRAWGVPGWFIWFLLGTSASCAYYFFVWVPAHADTGLIDAIRSEWTISVLQFGPAYILVGLMTLLHLRSPERTVRYLAKPEHRLLMTMAVVNFLLENHEFAVPAHQPVHFTRGYVWAALFLMGAPWLLNEAWPWLRQHLPRWGLILAAAFSGFFLLDNILFLGIQGRGQLRGTAASYWLTRDGRATLVKLNELYKDKELLVCQDLDLAHLAQVYTPYRTYCAHLFGAEESNRWLVPQTAFFHGEVRDPLLAGPLIAVSMVDSGAFAPPGRATLLYTNARYRIHRVEAP